MPGKAERGPLRTALRALAEIRQIAHQGRSTGLSADHASAIYELVGAVHNTPSVLNELLSHEQENRSQPRISLMDDVHAFREWIKRQQ